MIVFDLSCSTGHRFEGWFASSHDFAEQQAQGLVSCPQCGSVAIDKAPMAPAVPRKGNSRPDVAPMDKRAMTRGPVPAEVAQALAKLAEAQTRALKNSQWVGDDFAERSREMHYGEREAQTIHGEATADEARELFEEGIPVSPLPFPVAPPEELN